MEGIEGIKEGGKKRIQRWINLCAMPVSQRGEGNDIMETLAGKVSMAAMSFNVASAVKQYLQSIAPFLLYASPAALIQAAIEWNKNINKITSNPMYEFAYNNSSVVRNRRGSLAIDYVKHEKEANRIDKEAVGMAAAAGTVKWLKAKLDSAGMFLQTHADISMTTIGWTAVYNETYAKGDLSTPEGRAVAKEAAIAAANKALRESQPDTNAWSVSPAFEAGSGLMKAVTRMGLPANKLLNMFFRLPRLWREGQQKRVVSFVVGQMVVSTAIAAAFGKLGDSDDDDADKAKKLLYFSVFDPLTATVPFSPVQSGLQWSVQRVVTGEKEKRYDTDFIPLYNSVMNGLVDAKEGNSNKLAEDTISILGYGFGLPRTALLRGKKGLERGNAADFLLYAAGAADWLD